MMNLFNFKHLILVLFGYLLVSCAPGGGGSSPNSSSGGLPDGIDNGSSNPYTPPCSIMSGLACEVLALVNEQRQQQGLSKLVELGKCINEAQSHAEDMAANNYFSHDGLNETTAQRFARFGLGNGAWGENIANGYQTATAVMDGWMNSSGHRANILSSGFKSMGVGYTKNAQGKTYWVQCFSSMTQ